MRALLFGLAFVVACVPTLDQDPAITQPRILAIKSEPAEAKPGQSVQLSALVALDSGETLSWTLCTIRKPLTELGPVAQDCIERSSLGGEGFVGLGRGLQVTATIPPDACRKFGPLVPPAEKGGIAGRPVDPDRTGGYHQPVVVGSDIGTALGNIRLGCGVTGVPNAEAIRYNQSARPNENPVIERLEASRSSLRVGETIDLTGTWPTCPSAPACGDGLCTVGENATSCAADCGTAGAKGCGGAERYVYADQETRRIVEQEETLSSSWLSTSGTFTKQSQASASWTATVVGEARIWLLLRDDRGGVGWRELAIQVLP